VQLATFKSNFGGYVLATVVVLTTYGVVEAIAPQYATPLALVTILGVVLFYFTSRPSTAKHQ